MTKDEKLEWLAKVVALGLAHTVAEAIDAVMDIEAWIEAAS